MSRLIDADALIKALNLAEWFNVADFNEAVCTVRKAQPVDVVPVVHGQWKCADDLYENAVCSVCGWEASDPWTVIKILYKFCPNCGADMRKDGEQE